MHAPKQLARLWELDAPQRWMLAEAAAALLVARFAVGVLPFRRAVRLGSRGLRRGARTRTQRIEQVRWSIQAVAARLPWRAVCFDKGLALQWMLRGRGVDARLHYGVGYDRPGALSAHVWIAAGGEILIGGEEATRFKCVAVFP